MELETVFLSRQKNHTSSLAYKLVRSLVLVAHQSQQFPPPSHVPIGQSAGKLKSFYDRNRKRKKFSLLVLFLV
jgi:hypothetical protein